MIRKWIWEIVNLKAYINQVPQTMANPINKQTFQEPVGGVSNPDFLQQTARLRWRGVFAGGICLGVSADFPPNLAILPNYFLKLHIVCATKSFY